VHRAQKRKDTDIPYVGHLLGVASIVIDHEGNEEEAIAALLHDAPEDQGGKKTLDEIRRQFGNRVAAIVDACSDSLAVAPERKADWFTRKKAYLRHLAGNRNSSVLLVSVADKLHNVRSMLADYQIVKERLWRRFNPQAGKIGSILYYRSLLDIYLSTPEPRINRIAIALRETLRELEDASEASADRELTEGARLETWLPLESRKRLTPQELYERKLAEQDPNARWFAPVFATAEVDSEDSKKPSPSRTSRKSRSL
jgi:(p)ppGpp synthase/HD superfamily hydrolase